MARGYSQDLRDRVIDAVELEGMSRRQAAKRFGVSEAAAIKWLQRVRDTGVRTALGKGGHRRPVIEPHRDFVEAALTDKPDITLQALCDRLLAECGVSSDTSMMSRFLRRAGITFKKRRLSRVSRSVPMSAVIAHAGASIRPT
jgi:transposase